MSRFHVRRLWMICLAAILTAACGACSLPGFLLNTAIAPTELLTPIGDDATRLFVAVTRLADPNPLAPFVYVTPGPPSIFDIDAIDFATGARTSIRSGLGVAPSDIDPIYYYSQSMIAFADDHWLVTSTNTGAMSVFDIATGQDNTLLDGLFQLSNVRLAAVRNDRAIVVAPDFLLIVNLVTRAPTWFALTDLGFSPVAPPSMARMPCCSAIPSSTPRPIPPQCSKPDTTYTSSPSPAAHRVCSAATLPSTRTTGTSATSDSMAAAFIGWKSIPVTAASASCPSTPPAPTNESR